MTSNVAVLGAGSWGTALAKSISDSGHRVRLWARRKELVESIQSGRENAAYLPGAALAPSLTATHELAYALEGADVVLSVVPTQGLRETLDQAAPHFPPTAPILSATKGIEVGTLKLVSGIFEDHFSKDRHHLLSYLGGPSFAKEVAQGMPTAVVVAASDASSAERVQAVLGTDRLRVYTTDDVVGIELGGALKNVMAIAAGTGDGLGFGHNTRAAIITRGLAEMSRLAMKLGANPLTLAGLGGMGDLVLTCTGDLSRNRKVGLELGRGKKIGEILAGMSQVAEGVRTTQSAYELAKREGVDMPIVEAMYKVLYEDLPPLEAVVSLMTRKLRAERD
ncbi:MAG: NAD(P)-dependent glycerol-3-phosphate dehydrogenase [Deltaproteobacteria bacterium]|nr:NAD(P)-dependent glycerol-3-phosphate dehydrogenase [Deltaproteobacteria bacterium]